jgi:hypothetical protein
LISCRSWLSFQNMSSAHSLRWVRRYINPAPQHHSFMKPSSRCHRWWSPHRWRSPHPPPQSPHPTPPPCSPPTRSLPCHRKLGPGAKVPR